MLEVENERGLLNLSLLSTVALVPQKFSVPWIVHLVEYLVKIGCCVLYQSLSLGLEDSCRVFNDGVNNGEGEHIVHSHRMRCVENFLIVMIVIAANGTILAKSQFYDLSVEAADIDVDDLVIPKVVMPMGMEKRIEEDTGDFGVRLEDLRKGCHDVSFARKNDSVRQELNIASGDMTSSPFHVRQVSKRFPNDTNDLNILLSRERPNVVSYRNDLSFAQSEARKVDIFLDLCEFDLIARVHNISNVGNGSVSPPIFDREVPIRGSFIFD